MIKIKPSTAVLLLSSIVMSGGFAMGKSQPDTPREITPQDLKHLEAARLKRERKAAKKNKPTIEE